MSRSERVIQFIERFCRVPEGALVGSRLVLEPFQIEFLRAIYDNPKGTKKAYLSIARKNGKTALIACMVLVHLVGPEAKQNTQIVSGAMSRDQASIVFRLVQKMIGLNPALAELVRVVDSRKELYGLPMGTQFKALAAEGKTAHGLSPVLAIIDEPGQIKGPRSDFIDAIVTAQGAHDDPLLIAIGTQAAEDGDLWSVWLDDAAASGDPRIVAHRYEAPTTCKLDDPAAWKAANPALGVFRNLADVEQQATEAMRMPSAENTFRNLILNQRVSTVSPFMSRSVWESNGDTPHSLQDCEEVYAGLDLSSHLDLTAYVLIGRMTGSEVWHVVPYIFTPTEGLMDRARRDRVPYDVWHERGFIETVPGHTVDYDFVVRRIREINDGLNIVSVAFDRWRIKEFKAACERHAFDLPLVEHGQSFKSMDPALKAVEKVFLNKRARHGMHPVLTMGAAGAMVIKDQSGNMSLHKVKSTARIDAFVAMTMAFHAVDLEVETKPEPQYQFFVLG